MDIRINGSPCSLTPGETILELLKKNGMAGTSLKDRPLAARIGGEIFNLAYTPMHEADIDLIYYTDEEGKRVYERTLQFVLIMCVRKLFGKARVFVRYSLGKGVYITIDKEPAYSEADNKLLYEEMRRVTALDLKLVRKRMSIQDALDFFEKDGQLDKAALLKWRRFSYFDVYRCPEYSDYIDYYYGETAPSTGYVSLFDLHLLDGGLVMLRPRREAPLEPIKYVPNPKMAAVFRRSDEWGRIMTCSTANELNTRVENGTVRELIRVNEALHEKMFAKTADAIIERGAKAIMLAGPSSSGKTTSANRIATQLRAEGLDPIMISLDNYYCDRKYCPRDENGELDFEHINALDIGRFNHDLKLLMAGEEVETPIFDFIEQRPKDKGLVIKAGKDQPLIIEGIHGLNPLFTDAIADEAKYRIYVSSLAPIEWDDNSSVSRTDSRLIRRILRDRRYRNTSPQATIDRWPSVRRGEEKWVFPFQQYADTEFNSVQFYELSVLRNKVLPILAEITPDQPQYPTSDRLRRLLIQFEPIDDISLLPPISLLREFMGGSSFRY